MEENKECKEKKRRRWKAIITKEEEEGKGVSYSSHSTSLFSSLLSICIYCRIYVAGYALAWLFSRKNKKEHTPVSSTPLF